MRTNAQPYVHKRTFLKRIHRMDDLTNDRDCDSVFIGGRSVRVMPHEESRELVLDELTPEYFASFGIMAPEATKDFTDVPIEHIQDWQADIRERFDFSGYKELRE